MSVVLVLVLEADPLRSAQTCMDRHYRFLYFAQEEFGYARLGWGVRVKSIDIARIKIV